MGRRTNFRFSENAKLDLNALLKTLVSSKDHTMQNSNSIKNICTLACTVIWLLVLVNRTQSPGVKERWSGRSCGAVTFIVFRLNAYLSNARDSINIKGRAK